MTDTLHCPFCGAQLVDEGAKLGNENMVFGCDNLNCNFYGEKLYLKIWHALIDGKKAQDALKIATDFIGFINTSRHADGALAAMAIGKLNEIATITKQEDYNEK